MNQRQRYRIFGIAPVGCGGALGDTFVTCADVIF
jgi:hypothetical protein